VAASERRDKAKLMTAEELWELPDGFSRDELIEGVLLEMSPASAQHGRLGARFSALLFNHVEERALGVVYDGATGFVLERSPDSVLSPDISFVRADRVPEDDDRYLDLAPDLAVEVISPSNRAGLIEQKVAKYLAAGSALVLVVYPKPRHVWAHAADGTARLYREGDVIDFGDVVPGFQLAVADIFG
jgi:Uma2 family endonuclease